ncbi:MAG: hypothetical protein AVDCRST_MAG89-59, partial [uncultured Gemmatimonadetes bacterium]
DGLGSSRGAGFARRGARADPRGRRRPAHPGNGRGGAARRGDGLCGERHHLRRRRGGVPPRTLGAARVGGAAASRRRLVRRGPLRRGVPVDRARGPSHARAGEGVRRLGVADGRRRGVRALASAARAGFRGQHRGSGNAADDPRASASRPGAAGPRDHAARPVEAGAPALAGAVYRGDQYVPARQRRDAGHPSPRAVGGGGGAQPRPARRRDRDDGRGGAGGGTLEDAGVGPHRPVRAGDNADCRHRGAEGGSRPYHGSAGRGVARAPRRAAMGAVHVPLAGRRPDRSLGRRLATSRATTRL